MFFMAWAYERLGWISQEEIAQAHYKVAKELGAEVSPVGLAWSRCMKKHSEIVLFDEDLEHPNMLGTYLTSCVLYGDIFGESPVGLQYFPGDVTKDLAATL